MKDNRKRIAGISASSRLSQLVRESVERLGLKAAAEDAGVHADVLLRVVGRMPTRPGTIATLAHHFGLTAEEACEQRSTHVSP